MKDPSLEDRIKKLAEIPNVLAVRGERILPQAMSLLLGKESRRGLWWYRPETKVMEFSLDAKTHFQPDKFSLLKDFKGCVRGGVFSIDGVNYILIQTADFNDGIIPGKVFEDMCLLAETMSHKYIAGVVDEAGYNLLGS